MQFTLTEEPMSLSDIVADMKNIKVRRNISFVILGIYLMIPFLITGFLAVTDSLYTSFFWATNCVEFYWWLGVCLLCLVFNHRYSVCYWCKCYDSGMVDT